MKLAFITDIFKQELYNSAFLTMFPVLNTNDSDILFSYLLQIIDLTALKFGLNIPTLESQFRQNNYQDTISLLLTLLPYINTDTKSITSFNDLVKKKLADVDINKEEPRYIYTNFQYGRCDITLDNATEINYSHKFLEDNYILLRETIKTVANKLFVNWINIRPISPNDFKNKNIYKITNTAILNNTLSLTNDEHLDISDIYNVLSHDLYHNIKKLKWLIYTIKNRYVIEYLNDQLPLVFILQDRSWNNLSNKEVNLFKDSFKNVQKFPELNTVLTKFFEANYVKSSNQQADYIRDMYEYLRESFNFFKQTWYSHYFIDYDTNRIIVKTAISDQIRIKNIYNFAKSLIKFPELLPRDWRSLTQSNKTLIVNRLNSSGWFNITRSLAKSPQTLTSDDIFKVIKDNLASVIFDVLARKGVLTEFVADPELTDLKLSSQKIERLKKVMSENRVNYIESYYHVTNKPFGSLFVTNKQGDKKLYIDQISEESDLYSWLWNYSVDWISQIIIYHKYLNNRVIYLTGGTGVGKSTTGPRLLLYCLKMIDYKTDGVMIVTVPRISVALNVASFVAKQAGVNIFDYNKSVNSNVRTNQYYVQYDYQSEDTHIKKVYHPYLLFVTDGLLNNQLRNPILKKTLPGSDVLYSNLYDIVMVDEAHEHNTNMDIILTKMRYATYYNDTIKLVITSATMDQDEPIYRRYYRSVNDNQMAPYNMKLKEQKLDRINVDRRVHISRPGSTTKYVITDKFEPNKNPIDIVINLVNTSLTGNILLFEPGRKDILAAVDEINKRTANVSNVIAVPLYGEMIEYKRNLITKENMPYQLTNPKDIRYDVYDPEKDKSVPQGTYKYAIIVATPIAEASLTFEDLKYVIDTGIQKINKYSYKSRNDVLETAYIAESNRLQRRGRVGRTSSGTVYYMYDRYALINNKPSYNISISNLTDIVYQLLADDPNEPNFTTKYKISAFDYVGDVINKPPSQYSLTGYQKYIIDDLDGTFYIIHPNETSFKRNILGNIVGFINQDGLVIENNKVVSNLKMQSFWKANQERQFITEDFHKTVFGKDLFRIMIDTKLLYTDIISYLYAIKYECHNELLLVLAMIPDLRMGMSKLSKLLPKNNYGDIYTVLQVAYEIISFIKKNENSVRIDNAYDNAKQIFIQNMATNNFAGIDPITLDKLIIRYNHSELDNITQQDSLKLEINQEKLRKYCEFRGYNYMIVLSFYDRIKKLNKILNSDKTVKMLKDSDILNKINITWYPNTVYEKVLYSLLAAYYFNIYQYLGDNRYINLYNKDAIFSTITDNKNKQDTTLDVRYTSFNVMAIYNTDDEIMILSRINMDMLKHNMNMII